MGVGKEICIKVFISQPLNGISEEKIASKREAAIKDIKRRYGEDVVIVDSLINEEPPEGVNIPLWYFGESIKRMAKANIVYFVEGWTNARGCVIEHKCAFDYGLKRIYESC